MLQKRAGKPEDEGSAGGVKRFSSNDCIISNELLFGGGDTSTKNGLLEILIVFSLNTILERTLPVCVIGPPVVVCRRKWPPELKGFSGDG